MNYLELVNRVRQEGGVSGAALASLGGTLSQESQRVKSWVNEAWHEVQLHTQYWDFLRADFSFNTIASQSTYAPAAAPVSLSLRNWKRDTLRAYATAVGVGDEQLLRFLPWDRFRDHYLYGTQRTTEGRPVAFSIKPDKSLIFGPVPDAIYTITGEYYQQFTDLVGDTDSPAISSEYHMLIVWRALHAYGLYESAPEVVARAETGIKRMMSKLEADLMPEVVDGPPLA